MQLRQVFCSMLFAAVLGATTVDAQTAAEAKKAEATWSALLASLDSKRHFKPGTYDGAHVQFVGVLDDHAGAILRLRILRYDAAKDQFVQLPMVCRVTLSEEDFGRVAEYFRAEPASVQVFGKVIHLDASTKTIEVQSEYTRVTAVN